jgi:hypothetical protein
MKVFLPVNATIPFFELLRGEFAIWASSSLQKTSDSIIIRCHHLINLRVVVTTFRTCSSQVTVEGRTFIKTQLQNRAQPFSCSKNRERNVRHHVRVGPFNDAQIGLDCVLILLYAASE